MKIEHMYHREIKNSKKHYKLYIDTFEAVRNFLKAYDGKVLTKRLESKLAKVVNDVHGFELRYVGLEKFSYNYRLKWYVQDYSNYNDLWLNSLNSYEGSIQPFDYAKFLNEHNGRYKHSLNALKNLDAITDEQLEKVADAARCINERMLDFRELLDSDELKEWRYIGDDGLNFDSYRMKRDFYYI